jgi:cyclase
MTERFIRHGNYLTHVYMIEDPYYLTEPLIKTSGFQLVQNPAMQPYPCYPAVEVPREKGEVPHHLPGENPFLNDFAKKHNLPVNAVRGGAETALPEFMTAKAPDRRPAAGARKPNAPADTDVHSLHVQGNVWMLTGGGVNAAVQIGDEGVLVVDTMSSGYADKLISEIKKLAGDKPIRWIVNTHVDPDHTGGNAKVAEAGESIIAGNFAAQAGQSSANFAKILTHENVEARMVKVQPALPTTAMPTDTFFTDDFEMHFNGEAVQFIHVPNAHTDGDVMVFFRKSDVLVAGDAFNTTSFPVVDLESGGSLNGVVKTLNRILDITVPEDKQEGGTYVIPGHGRLTDEADVVEYRDMMTIIRDRVKNAVDKGMTLEQVKTARLVRDYEGRYGAANGSATTDAFVETAYRSLKEDK